MTGRKIKTLPVAESGSTYEVYVAGGEQRGGGGEQHQDRLQVGLNITLVAFIITITLITL